MFAWSHGRSKTREGRGDGGCTSVGRVVLDKLARFKSNPRRKGWESLEGGGRRVVEGHSTSCFAFLAGACARVRAGV